MRQAEFEIPKKFGNPDGLTQNERRVTKLLDGNALVDDQAAGKS